LSRRRWIFLAGAVALLGLAAVFVARRPPAGTSEGGLLFAGFERERAIRIEVQGKTADEGIVLEKSASGWIVPAEAGYAADPEGVGEILDFVGSARADRRVSDNPAKRGAYEVDDDGLKVKVEGTEGVLLAQWVIGKSGPDFLSTYVRKEDSDEVFLLDQSLRRIFVRVGPRQWRDKAIFRLSGPDITKMQWSREGKTVALEADAAGNWTLTAPATAPAQRDEAEALRNALSTLMSDDFAAGVSPAAAGLDAPYARMEFALRDGTRHTLEVGKENDRSQRHARRGGSDTVFLVNNFRINTVFKSAEELQAPPPQAEAGAAAAPPPAPASGPATAPSPAPKQPAPKKKRN
jgi:hypothetical protein